MGVRKRVRARLNEERRGFGAGRLGEGGKRERERGEKVPNTRNTRATYFCKSGFIRKARVVRRDVELPELPILYKKTFKETNTYTLYTRTHIRTHSHEQGHVYEGIYTYTSVILAYTHTHARAHTHTHTHTRTHTGFTLAQNEHVNIYT